MSVPLGQELRDAWRHARRFCALVTGALAALLLLYELSTMLYSIKPNQLGLVEFMGAVTNPRVLPGLHLTWPWPLSRVHRVPAKEVQRMLVDTFFQDSGAESRSYLFYRLTGLESYCLSGDNNAVEIAAVIQYTISDPYAYLYGCADKEELLRSIVCRRTIALLAERTIDEILTYGKKEIGQKLRAGVQQDLDRNRTGISVALVEIKEIRPPLTVQPYFDDVINSQVDKRKMISRAESYRNEQIPAARAEKERLLRAAEAYRDTTVKSAQGETERFGAKLAEYSKAPEISRRRLYLRAAREILGRIGSLCVVDGEEGRSAAKLRIFSSP